MRELISIIPYLLNYRYRLFGGIVFVILANFFAVLAPQFTGYILDRVLGEFHSTRGATSYNVLVRWAIGAINHLDATRIVFWSSACIVFLAFMRGLFMYFMRQSLVVMSRYVEYDQKSALFDKYVSLDIKEVQKRTLGEFMTTMAEDVGRVRMMVGPVVMYIVNILSISSWVIYYMFTKSVPLTIGVLVPLPLMALVIYKMSTRIHRRTTDVQASLSDIASFARNVYTGIRVVKSFNQDEKLAQRFGKRIRLHRDRNLKLSLVESIFTPSMSFIVAFSLVINVGLGGLLVMRGALSLGTLAEFVMYLQMLVFPFFSIGWVSDLVQRAIVSQKRIRRLLEIPSAIVGGTATPVIHGKVVFDGVSFRYPHQDRDVLDDVSLTIFPKSRVGIVGTVGSGKSTLVDMLLRFYDPKQGQIFVDDVALPTMDLAHLRRHISWVAQDVFLFSGTIADNVRMANASLTDAEIETLLASVALWEDVCMFPQGMRTVIGEKGVSLSGGQRQRLSIARALAKRAPLLILDDCFSAIDIHTEASIIAEIAKHPSIETMIIISNRYTIMPTLDMIFVMDEGKIVEQGTHRSLLEKNTRYSKLYAASLVRSKEDGDLGASSP